MSAFNLAANQPPTQGGRAIVPVLGMFSSMFSTKPTETADLASAMSSIPPTSLIINEEIAEFVEWLDDNNVLNNLDLQKIQPQLDNLQGLNWQKDQPMPLYLEIRRMVLSSTIEQIRQNMDAVPEEMTVICRYLAYLIEEKDYSILKQNGVMDIMLKLMAKTDDIELPKACSAVLAKLLDYSKEDNYGKEDKLSRNEQGCILDSLGQLMEQGKWDSIHEEKIIEYVFTVLNNDHYCDHDDESYNFFAKATRPLKWLNRQKDQPMLVKLEIQYMALRSTIDQIYRNMDPYRKGLPIPEKEMTVMCRILANLIEGDRVDKILRDKKVMGIMLTLMAKTDDMELNKACSAVLAKPRMASIIKFNLRRSVENFDFGDLNYLNLHFHNIRPMLHSDTETLISTIKHIRENMDPEEDSDEEDGFQGTWAWGKFRLRSNRTWTEKMTVMCRVLANLIEGEVHSEGEVDKILRDNKNLRDKKYISLMGIMLKLRAKTDDMELKKACNAVLAKTLLTQYVAPLTAAALLEGGEEGGELQCKICHEALVVEEEVFTGPCRHALHSVCARHWFKESIKSNCPLCRMEMVPNGDGA